LKNKEKLAALVAKYNDVLYESFKITLAEDLVNLIIVNQEDQNFDLRTLMSQKSDFKEFVIREFFKNNYKPVTKNLSKMEEQKIKLSKN
jgi:hypothetical protein